VGKSFDVSTLGENTCALVLLWLLAGCAGLQGPAYTYNEIVIVNQSRVPVRDVVIAATESGKLFSCGNIAPRGICSNEFQPQTYRGDPIQVSWVVGDARRRNETIELTLPTSFVAELPMRGVFVISDQGDMSAYLQQEPPGPHI
jgi:hypothetical protein